MGGDVYEKLIEHTQKFRQRYATAINDKKAASKSDRQFLLKILEVNLYKSIFVLDMLTG